MKNIDELVRIVTSNSINTKPFVFGLKTGTKTVSLLKEYASASKPNIVATRTRMKVPAFRKLKSRLSEQLVRSILLSDSNRLIRSKYDRQYNKALRNQMLANILFLNYSKHSASELLEKNYRVADKFHFTELSINSIRLLKYHAALSGKKRLFIYYSKKLIDKVELLEQETIIEEYTQEIILELNHSATVSLRREEEFINRYGLIESIVKAFPSRTNIINSCRYGVHLMEYLQKHEEVLKICSVAEQFLKKYPHLSQRMRWAEFALYKLNSCLRMQNISAGEKCAKDCERIFLKSTDNWYIYLEYYFLLCMHTGNYSKAEATWEQVKNDDRFLKKYQVRFEKWRIYEAYLHFAHTKSTPHGFNLYRFLNEVPLHSTDKSGFNLAILIAQIISLVDAGKFDEILVKSDALNIYCRRYIRIKDKYRTYYFMKMLQVMIKYSFEPKKTEQIAQKFLEYLQKPAKEKRPLEEMEVIPYEVLWKMILAKLREADKAA